MNRLITSTRVSGSGEISRSNAHFKRIVQDSGDLTPKYGKAKAQYESKQQLNKLFQ